MKRFGLILLAIAGLGWLTGCEDKQEVDLFKAQLCIDKATAATVNSCLTQIDGDNSRRAFVMRCSAAFISEGIDEIAIVNALENIDGEEGGDPTAPAIAALAMSDTTTSAQALTTCTQTESSALISLANFANLATAMKALLGFTAGASGADIENLIDTYVGSIPPDSADKEALGAAVIASQESLCNPDDGLFRDDDACVDINAAIASGGGDPNDVADALMANLDDQEN
jgi:hypothetical protein